jgi:hypothetical protein
MMGCPINVAAAARVLVVDDAVTMLAPVVDYEAGLCYVALAASSRARPSKSECEPGLGVKVVGHFLQRVKPTLQLQPARPESP